MIVHFVTFRDFELFIAVFLLLCFYVNVLLGLDEKLSVKLAFPQARSHIHFGVKPLFCNRNNERDSENTMKRDKHTRSQNGERRKRGCRTREEKTTRKIYW